MDCTCVLLESSQHCKRNYGDWYVHLVYKNLNKQVGRKCLLNMGSVMKRISSSDSLTCDVDVGTVFSALYFNCSLAHVHSTPSYITTG